MTGMKITVDAAMRARDVSRPSAEQEALAMTSPPTPAEREDSLAEPRPRRAPGAPVPGPAREPSRSQAGRHWSGPERGNPTSQQPGTGPERPERGAPAGSGASPATPERPRPSGPRDGAGPATPERPKPSGPRDGAGPTPARASATERPRSSQSRSGPRRRRRARLGLLARRQDQTAGRPDGSPHRAAGQGSGGNSPDCS
jgi:hypothetical protein